MTAPDNPHHDTFLRLFLEHEPALRTYVRTLTPSVNDTSEVLQSIAVVMWRKFPEFDQTRNFRRWAFGVARYEALAYLRDRARDRHVFDEALLHTLADEAAMAAPRHDVQREALAACLEKLPATQRELILEAYTEGNRIDGIAARLGRSAMSLYQLLHRIRLALLRCVQRTITTEVRG